MQTKNFTLMILLSLAWVGHAGAQVVITAANGTPPAAYSDTLYFGMVNNLGIPAAGANQVWDYSQVQNSSNRVVDFADAAPTNYFPGAYSISPGSLQFQAFQAESGFFLAVDEEGIYDVGRLVTETSFPLTPITGNPADRFVFVADTVAYEGRVNDIQFPMTYLDSFGGSRIERSNLSISVAAFGLTNAPVETRRYLNQTSTVIGYGQVIIPLEDQSPSPPIEVLLVQVDRTVMDSIFVAGSVAPPVLLAPFGVSQGQTASDRHYFFVTPFFDSPVVRINLSPTGTVNGFIYRPRAARLVSGVRNLSQTNLQVWPNPVQRGQILRLQAEESLGAGVMRLVNLQGQVVQSVALPSDQRDYELAVPPALAPGTYWLQAFDQQGRMLRAKPVAVH